jgi:uncharacterized protein (DUF427 family)
MKSSEWLRAAREHWAWRGADRPPFADVPGPGQESVWDYPRPPALLPDDREVVVRWEGMDVARTRRAIRILETSHPPSFYLPWDDVDRDRLVRGGGGSFCEWKGPAVYWDLVDGARRAANAAWSYPRPLAGAEALADRVAFYPSIAACFVDGPGSCRSRGASTAAGSRPNSPARSRAHREAPGGDGPLHGSCIGPAPPRSTASMNPAFSTGRPTA